MELTTSTLEVLKNFASINSNLVFNNNNVVKTVSENRAVFSTAILDVSFPETFGIYDLNEFLSTLSLLDDPRLKFDEKYLVISDGSGRTRIKYFYSDVDNLTHPTNDVIMPETEVNFTLDRETLMKIKRATAVLGHSEMSVTSSNGVLSLNVIDNNDESSNAFSIDVDGSFDIEKPNFKLIFNVSNLKMIDGNYEVGLSSAHVSHFINKETGTQYWVALEKHSSYGE